MKLGDAPVFITADEAIDALKAAAWTEHVDIADVEGIPSHLETLNRLRSAARLLRNAPQDFITGRMQPTTSDEVAELLEWVDAIPEPPKPRQLVHSFLGSFGADHDLDSAIDLVKRASRIAWAPSLFGHELAVEVAPGLDTEWGASDRTLVYRFDVKAPEAVNSA